MNTFTMKLQPNHFYYMKNGTKRIELRLNDEKRSKISVGDKIIFFKEPLLDESFETTVIKLLKSLQPTIPMTLKNFIQKKNK